MIALTALALYVASVTSPALAQTAGSFADAGNSLVSAMMMFLGNDQKVYILDKAENNAAQVDGHPAWGSVWDINTHQTEVMSVLTNVFCASGYHLPNGSYATFGGNGPVGPGGVADKTGVAVDPTFQDYDGGQAIRVLNPCTDSDDFTSSNCQWFDNPQVLSMLHRRWYATAEALADGTIVLIGGFVNGGYINRNTPNTDPTEGGGADLTYEFYPANGRPATTMQFMITTSGLNSYAHAFLMSSGNMFVQANWSTIMWDYNANVETPLPDMPGRVVRVYPASGAVAMLPLTPANNYTPTMIFCGGVGAIAEEDWGNYLWPHINPWEVPASADCQRITPEPTDGSDPVYVQDDDLIQGRTMGQFITLPTGQMLLLNGAENGTAGYSTQTDLTPPGEMPYGMSLSNGPVLQPALYDPNAPKGNRWSNAGLSSSKIPRLYHSSAMLLPDGSVLVAGSNPNVDVNLNTVYPTTYDLELFYPPYFSASTRPVPSGVPPTISYGGPYFNLTVPASSYTGSANDAADNTTVVLLRGGFTTHAMNMGQRYLQLNNTYTVNNDSSITLHVSQAPPNANIFQPGPTLLFVVINGIPSNGTMVIVGSGAVETQPTAPAADLPPSTRLTAVSGSGGGGSGTGSTTNSSASGGSHAGAIAGGVIGAVAVIGILGALAGIYVARRRRNAAVRQTPYVMASTDDGVPLGFGAGVATAGGAGGLDAARTIGDDSDKEAFVPLHPKDYSGAPSMSNMQLNLPYRDDATPSRDSQTGTSGEYDPYNGDSAAVGGV